MSVEFGNTGNGTYDSTTSPIVQGFDVACPGIGDKKVLSLKIRSKNPSQSAGNYLRLAIYSAYNGNLIAQGSARFMSPVDYAWNGHTDFVDSDGDPIADVILQGGTTYILTFTSSGSGESYRMIDGSTNYLSIDYTNGFPATINLNNASGYEPCIKCEIEDYVPPTTIAPTTAPPLGTVCWGHDTGVTESNIRNLTGNWSGSGYISGVGDAERINFVAGENEESETWNIGARRIKIQYNKYSAGSGVPTIKYKNGASQALCEADTWHTYVGSFVCSGWVKVRIET